MVDVTVLPVAVYPNGSYTVPETAIGDSITSLQIAVNFQTTANPTIWPNVEDFIRFDLEVWDGVAWRTWNSPAIGWGGLHVAKGGVELPLMYMQGTLPAVAGRRLRGSVTIGAQAPRTGIRTGCVVTVL